MIKNKRKIAQNSNIVKLYLKLTKSKKVYNNQNNINSLYNNKNIIITYIQFIKY